MNILITGANGFIGKHLIRHFKNNHQLFTIVRKVDGENKLVKSYEIDLSDVSLVKEKFKENIGEDKIDVIIHSAAVLSSQNNKDIKIFDGNNAITESLIHIAKVCGASKLINFSTIGVYPNMSGVYDENSAVEPSVNFECLYGLSKLCSEELFKFYLKNTTKIINLRLGQVYGKGMREDRIFSIMKAELQKDNTITVFGNGERMSNFVSIDYLINKIDKIVYYTDLEGTYNLGEKNISYLELAQMIIAEFGNISSKIILEEQGISSKVIINSDKINNL